MESTLKNMVLTLFVITLISSAAVGVVYGITKEPIEKAKSDKTKNALSQVLPKFDNDPAQSKQTVTIDNLPIVVYTAKQADKTVGYAIETITKKGFGGEIKLMVGFLPNGDIHNIEVLQQNETPGLGDKIMKSKSNFSVQFNGKNPETFKMSVRKDGGDVDAITASTISSRAFTDAVTRAFQAFKNVKEGGSK